MTLYIITSRISMRSWSKGCLIMDTDISLKETKNLVCLFCGDVDMFGP